MPFVGRVPPVDNDPTLPHAFQNARRSKSEKRANCHEKTSLRSLLLVPARYEHGCVVHLALSAQDNSFPAPIVRSAVSFGVSAPLRELAKLPAPSQYGLPANHLLRPMRRGSAGHVVDTVEQSTAASGSNFSIKVNVGGIGVGFSGFISGFSYPNANIAVGDIQVVEVVNNSSAIYNKSTGVWTSASYLNPNYIWTTGPCSQYSPEAYPIVQ
jgi:hypothetical protein